MQTSFTNPQVALSALNAWIEAQLVGANAPALAALLFVGGFLASLLPCVYPLYPITAAIVRQRGSRSTAWVHPVAYYLGLAGMYAVFGIAAALGGGIVSSVLRYGTTNVAIGVVFVILALATMDQLLLPLFRPRDIGERSGVLGTALMGASAGLLSSACVGPVVVSILLSLAAASATGASLGSLAAGGAKMLAFGLGVGVPFLVIGLFGVRLPRSGAWMRWIQRALGLLILYFAWLYLEKGLGIWGLRPEQTRLVVLAAVGIYAFAHRLQVHESDTYLRTQRALYVVGTVCCAALMFNGLGAAGVPPEAIPVRAAATEQDGALVWHLDPDAAYAAARAQGRNVFIDFYGAWCTNCKEFARMTRENAALGEALSRAVLLKIYDTHPAFDTYRSDPRFSELNVGLPFFVITTPAGELLYKTTDYLALDEMRLFLDG